jgi:hypothetical protein
MYDIIHILWYHIWYHKQLYDIICLANCCNRCMISYIIYDIIYYIINNSMIWNNMLWYSVFLWCHMWYLLWYIDFSVSFLACMHFFHITHDITHDVIYHIINHDIIVGIVTSLVVCDIMFHHGGCQSELRNLGSHSARSGERTAEYSWILLITQHSVFGIGRLAQVGEHSPSGREIAGSNPDPSRTNQDVRMEFRRMV